MDIKKLIVATLAGSFIMWLLAGLWHEIIMAKFYASQTDATHEGTLVILVAYVILAFLMSYLYRRWRQDGQPIMQGLRFGVVVGLLWVFPHELAMAGAHGDSLVYVFQNAAWHMVEQGVGGIVIALIYGRGPNGSQLTS